MADNTTETAADPWLGRYVIVRCRDGGVHAGVLREHSGRQAELSESRRAHPNHAGR